MKNFLAAGTVDCVYPAPVQADTWQDVCQWMKDELPSHSDKFGLVVDTALVCKFDTNGAYIKATIGGYDEDAFGHVGTMNESHKGYGFNLVAIKRLSYSPLVKVHGATLKEFRLALEANKAAGTLRITFKYYPNGFKCYASELKTFRIAL